MAKLQKKSIEEKKNEKNTHKIKRKFHTMIIFQNNITIFAAI